MFSKTYSKIIFIAAFAILLVPTIGNAAPAWWPIVPCGLTTQPESGLMDTLPDGTKVSHDFTQPCNQCDLILLAHNLIDLVLYGLIPVLGTFFFLLGGFYILISRGNSAQITKGRTIMKDTAIGIVIILSSWLITNFVLKSIATDEIAGAEWNKIECRVGSLKDLTDATVPSTGGPGGTTTQPPAGTCKNSVCANGVTGPCRDDADCKVTTGPTTGGGRITAGTCSGVACSRDTSNVCGPVDPGDGCDITAVNSLNAAIAEGAGNKTIAPGVDTIKLLKAIIANESDGRVDIGSSDGKSAGPFQLTLSTANPIRARCGITETISFAWLKRSDTVSKQACLAAEILKDVVRPGTCGADVRQIAAGYNGGPGVCQASNACGGSGSCSICSGENRPTKKWECLWEDTQHNKCNINRPNDKGYSHTRIYAPRVEYCYDKF